MKIFTTVMMFWIILQLVGNRILVSKNNKENGRRNYPFSIFIGLVIEIIGVVFALKYIWNV